jgi:hypothetical protein
MMIIIIISRFVQGKYFLQGKLKTKNGISRVLASIPSLIEGLDPSLLRAIKLRKFPINIMSTGERWLAGSTREGQLISFCAVLKIKHTNLLFGLEVCFENSRLEPYTRDTSNW